MVWKILDYFFLLRPTLFFPLWTVLLAGRFNSESEAPIVWVFLFFAFILGATYTINQLQDIESDKSNQKLFLLADGYITRNSATWLTVIFNAIGLAGMFAMGYSFGLLSILFILVTGILYNLKPFAWKDQPLPGILISVLGGGMAFYFGCLPKLNYILMCKSLPYMAAFGAVAVLTTVPDMEGDAESGKKTFALIYRVRKTTIIAALLCFISAIGGWITQDRIIFWPAILSSPIFILAVFLQTKEAVILSIKFSILLLSLSVGLRFPWYLVLMGIYFFGARWYYRKRFNIDYPSFKLE